MTAPAASTGVAKKPNEVVPAGGGPETGGGSAVSSTGTGSGTGSTSVGESRGSQQWQAQQIIENRRTSTTGYGGKGIEKQGRKEVAAVVVERDGTSELTGRYLHTMLNKIGEAEGVKTLDDEMAEALYQAGCDKQITEEQDIPAWDRFNFNRLTDAQWHFLQRYMYQSNLILAGMVGYTSRSFEPSAPDDTGIKPEDKRGWFARTVARGKQYTKSHFGDNRLMPLGKAQPEGPGLEEKSREQVVTERLADEYRRKLSESGDIPPELVNSAFMRVAGKMSLPEMAEMLTLNEQARIKIECSLRGLKESQIVDIESVIPPEVKFRAGAEGRSPLTGRFELMKAAAEINKHKYEEGALAIARGEGGSAEHARRTALHEAFGKHAGEVIGAEGSEKVSGDYERAKAAFEEAEEELNRSNAAYTEAYGNAAPLLNNEHQLQEVASQIANLDVQIHEKAEERNKLMTDGKSAQAQVIYEQISKLHEQRGLQVHTQDLLTQFRDRIPLASRQEILRVHKEAEDALFKTKKKHEKAQEKLKGLTKKEADPKYKLEVSALYQITHNNAKTNEILGILADEGQCIAMLNRREDGWKVDLNIVRRWFGLQSEVFDHVMGEDNNKELLSSLARSLHVDAGKMESESQMAEVARKVIGRLASGDRRKSLKKIAGEAWDEMMQSCVSTKNKMSISTGYRYEGDELEGRRIAEFMLQRNPEPKMQRILEGRGIFVGVNSLVKYFNDDGRLYAVVYDPQSGANAVIDQNGRNIGSLERRGPKADDALGTELLSAHTSAQLQERNGIQLSGEGKWAEIFEKAKQEATKSKVEGLIKYTTAGGQEMEVELYFDTSSGQVLYGPKRLPEDKWRQEMEAGESLGDRMLEEFGWWYIFQTAERHAKPGHDFTFNYVGTDGKSHTVKAHYDKASGQVLYGRLEDQEWQKLMIDKISPAFLRERGALMITDELEDKSKELIEYQDSKGEIRNGGGNYDFVWYNPRAETDAQKRQFMHIVVGRDGVNVSFYRNNMLVIAGRENVPNVQEDGLVLEASHLYDGNFDGNMEKIMERIAASSASNPDKDEARRLYKQAMEKASYVIVDPRKRNERALSLLREGFTKVDIQGEACDVGLSADGKLFIVKRAGGKTESYPLLHLMQAQLISDTIRNEDFAMLRIKLSEQYFRALQQVQREEAQLRKKAA